MMREWARRRARPALVDVHDDLATRTLNELHGDGSLVIRESTGQESIAADFLAGMGKRRDLETGMVNFAFQQVTRRGRLTWL